MPITKFETKNIDEASRRCKNIEETLPVVMNTAMESTGSLVTSASGITQQPGTRQDAANKL
eukprot:1936996-Amphidinium_carterae.1